MILPFPKVFNDNDLHSDKKNTNSPSQNAKTRGDNSPITQYIVNHGPAVPTSDQLETQRRQEIVAKLRYQWLLSNDGITAARAAGLEWGEGEKEWVNKRLIELGENWQI